MAWKIKFSEAADAQLSHIGSTEARRIIKQLQWLAELTEPRQLLSPMKYEAAGLYKYCIGNFRVILQMADDRTILFIIMIEHRSSVYKSLKRKG